MNVFILTRQPDSGDFPPLLVGVFDSEQKAMTAEPNAATWSPAYVLSFERERGVRKLWVSRDPRDMSVSVSYWIREVTVL